MVHEIVFKKFLRRGYTPEQAFKFASSLLLSYDESKHPRDEKGQWTASPESNKKLIEKHQNIEKTKVATRAGLGAGIGISGAVTGNLIAIGGGPAISAISLAEHKLRSKKRIHKAILDEMYLEMQAEIEKWDSNPHLPIDKVKKVPAHLDKMIRTYVAFKNASTKEKEHAIKTNTLHKLIVKNN